MQPETPSRQAARFLLRFSIAAGVLFLLRPWLWTAYLAVAVPLANGALAWTGGGARYEAAGQVLALVYPGLGLRFTIHDILYQNLIVTASLFVATAGAWRWRLRWMGMAGAVLLATHVASLYAAAQTVVWDYAGTLSAPERAHLAANVGRWFPASADWFYSRAFGLWHAWGRPAVGLVVWLLAAGPTLGLPRSAAETLRGSCGGPAGVGAQAPGAQAGYRCWIWPGGMTGAGSPCH